MADEKPYRYLNTLLAKAEHNNIGFRDFLCDDADVTPVAIAEEHKFDGALYIKNPKDKRPRWAELVDEIVGKEQEQLSNKSSSAVFLIRIEGRVLAITFGYGRFLLKMGHFEQDFGLRTALNTLDHHSLRSVDLHTIEDQPLQRRSQSVRGSEASVFGVDIFRDVLRAVTGSPRKGVEFRSISGGDAIYSFGQHLLVEDIPKIAAEILGYHEMELYKDSFGWVDNIRRVKDSASIFALEERLLRAIKTRDADLVITLPEIIEWDSVLGFSFTRTKREMSPVIDTHKYLAHVDAESVSIESVRRDRLFVSDIHGNEFGYSVYTCLYFEQGIGATKCVLFGGNWYEIDKSFMDVVEATLTLIELSDIPFPSVEKWDEDGKTKIEAEGAYNERAALKLGCHLLDKKLVKCSKTTSPIELCDLLTSRRQVVHVKHRKGGSAGLSHLFAQGGVSAEVMLGDRAFRKQARKVLRRVHSDALDLLPLDGLKSSDYEIVFLMLGDANDRIKENLPFFSKVNLARVYENLSQRGFKVSVAGVDTVIREPVSKVQGHA